jgi:hypothetical protein
MVQDRQTIDWSGLILPVLLAVAGSILGSVVGPLLISARLFHNFLATTFVFTGGGAIAGFVIGMRVSKNRPPMKPATKTRVRLVVAGLLIVSGIVEALPDLVRGRISWRLVQPITELMLGVALLFPPSRLISTKSARIIVIILLSVMTLLFFASDYGMKKFSDLYMWLALACILLVPDAPTEYEKWRSRIMCARSLTTEDGDTVRQITGPRMRPEFMKPVTGPGDLVPLNRFEPWEPPTEGGAAAYILLNPVETGCRPGIESCVPGYSALTIAGGRS